MSEENVSSCECIKRNHTKTFVQLQTDSSQKNTLL
eukprot:UN23933